MATLENLPNELIAHILSFLDSSSVLEPLFCDNAAEFLDEYYAARSAPDIGGEGSYQCRTHLKSTSRVSRRWRQATLPHLFRHVIWTFERLEQPDVESDDGTRFELPRRLPQDKLPDLLQFLRSNNLASYVDGLTVYVPYPEHLVGKDADHVGRYGVLPSTQRQASGQGFDMATSWGPGAVVRSDIIGHPTWDNNWFWQMLLAELDLLRVSLVSSPAILATMVSRKVFVSTGSSFRMRHHVLSLSRELRAATGAVFDADDMRAVLAQQTSDGTREAERRYSAPPCDNLSCDLFSLRNWTSLLVNEGSSLPVYSTEAYGDMPPSPFLSLLCSDDPSTAYLFTRTLRRLAYVAIVPMATHIQASLYLLAPPQLEELYVQIMPRDVNVKDFAYGGVDMEDILVERDSIYGLLFAGIFIPEPEPTWEPLRVFETGDAADKLAWAEAVETVAASSSCWEVERRGRLMRNLGKEKRRRGGRPSVLETFNEAMW